MPAEYLKNELDRYNKFVDIYGFRSLFILDKLREKTYVGNKKARRCRFCGTTDKKKFRTDAHAIPKGIGNKFLLNAFECDDCNQKFSLYENDLVSFLSPFRPFAKISGVKHKEPGIELILPKNAPSTQLHLTKGYEAKFKLDEVTKQATVSGLLPPHRPLLVFKALYKIGISMLADSDMTNYKNGIGFLRSDIHDSKMNGQGLFHIMSRQVPGGQLWSKPIAVLYEKKIEKADSLHLTHVLQFYFGNHVLCLGMPWNNRDSNLIGNKYTLLDFPITTNPEYMASYLGSTFQLIDLSSNQLVRDREYEMSFTYHALDKFPDQS